MELNIVVKQYLESVGGQQCPICNEWDDKSRYVHGICGECNQDVEEVMDEAENW